jgi:hypothetical protein
MRRAEPRRPLNRGAATGTDAYRLLRFGQENVIALQLDVMEYRLARLDEF